MLGTVLIVILVLVLLGGVGGPYLGAPWQAGYGGGPYLTGGLGLIVVVVVILVLFGRL